MKLDKIKFAMLVHYITNRLDVHMDAVIIESLDELIDVEVPVQLPIQVSCSSVDNLLELMANGIQKIEAIKAYRILTGVGLKESKDAVEKYWVSKRSNATLGDILDQSKRDLNY